MKDEGADRDTIASKTMKKMRKGDNEDPPKPVSSSSEDESSSSSEDEEEHSSKQEAQSKKAASTAITGQSQLFRPYRTLGIVSSGSPFHLIPHQSSQSAMACVPIGDRFQLLQTDRLHPVMVSQAVPSSHTTLPSSSPSSAKKPQNISSCVTDATLSITVVAHGPKVASCAVTLYHRTKPYRTMSLCGFKKRSNNSWWSIKEVLHLGRNKVTMSSGEKEGTKENAAIIAIIMARHKIDDDDTHDSVPVVGTDDNEDDSESDSEEENSSSDEEEENEEDCMGQVVLLVATRTTLQIQRRIRLVNLPNFAPVTAMHPATYLNKIVLAGSNEGKPAMLLLNVRSTKVVHIFKCLQKYKDSSNSSAVTALEQSPAVDTIAVGTNKGMVHLVNLRHDQKLFSLRHQSKQNRTKNYVSIQSISFRTDGSAMQYGIAPMAVGRSDGTITVWDLSPPKEDNEDDNQQPLTSRSGGRAILCEMHRVHVGGISKLQYLPQEPLLLSTGLSSNAVLMHIFDNPDHSPRILRQRKGHTAPPRCIRYLHPGAGAGGGILANASDGTDASACQILSSGGTDRTLRVFSTARTVLDKEYSQGKGLEKRARQLGLLSTAELLLPPVQAMAMAESRTRDWGDLVTIHQNHAFAYVWSTKRGAQSGPLLRQAKWNVSAMKVKPPRHANATAVAMSACGNFALVGTAGGVIYKYNVQSGNPRGSYPRGTTDVDEGEGRTRRREAGDINRTIKALEKANSVSNRASNLDKMELDAEQESKREQWRTEKMKKASHRNFAVTGIAIDSVNKIVISVGADAKLILWHFATHFPHKKSPYKLPCAATKLCHVRDSDLAAVSLEDFTVILYDCAALNLVRRFGTAGTSARHTGPITDLGFSPDGRNLFSSSMDSTIRVWDVPTNTCVDWLSFKTPPTSLTISPTGEFLATTHSGKLGISIWSDRSYYQTIYAGESLLLEPAHMDDPIPIANASGVSEQRRGDIVSTVNSQNSHQEDEVETEGGSRAPAVAKESGLITLSGLPPAHWKNLFHLELVKERNKPKEPPKKPPSAPFFLQWRGSDISGEDLVDKESERGAKPNDGDEEEWAAAWSDHEDGDGDTIKLTTIAKDESKSEVKHVTKAVPSKRRKVTHHRSHFASLLEQCNAKRLSGDEKTFQPVTDYVATLGPSAIDVALSTLCNGMHDLSEGLPLLHLACLWLLEACQSRERFDAVNAYLNRFLCLHASVITGIDDSFPNDGSKYEETSEKRMNLERQQRVALIDAVSKLRRAQLSASDELRGKLQNTLCLLRHFSRMV